MLGKPNSPQSRKQILPVTDKKKQMAKEILLIQMFNHIAIDFVQSNSNWAGVKKAENRR